MNPKLNKSNKHTLEAEEEEDEDDDDEEKEEEDVINTETHAGRCEWGVEFCAADCCCGCFCHFVGSK